MFADFFCTICHESYASSEDIYKTRCGHVFHRQCITNWLSRSTTCSDCRTYCSSSDIVKIMFASRDVDCEDIAEKNLKLKSHLEQANKNFSEIQKMLEESEKNFAELLIQLDAANSERTNTQRDLEQMKIISKALETELVSKRVENRHHQEELMKAYEEMNKLNAENVKQKCNIDLSEEIKAKTEIIEDLNKQINEKSLELQKEIRNSTKLIVEKMELRQRLNAAMQRRASFTNNNNNNISTQCKQPNAVQTTDLTMTLQNLEIRLNKFGQNEGISENTRLACGNNRDTGAIQKRLSGICRPRLDSQTFALFQYAKNLRSVGFRDIFFDNVEVFARFDRAQPKIQITSKEQVDELIKKFNEINSLVNHKSENVNKSKDGCEKIACDAQFYAI